MRFMSILVINAGSTSLKFSLFNKEKLELKGNLELKEGLNLSDALHEVKKKVQGNAAAIGHRVVHGGDFFTGPAILNPRKIEKIASFASLAPLHNPVNVEGIKIAMRLFPNIPHVAVFDTSFHSKIPLQNKVYPIPYSWYEKGVKRYGFHGINHQYCMEKAAEMLGKDIKKAKLITCHLGGGASLAAITDEHSIDTTMGFTPLEGLMMATRSGSLDPGILLYLLDEEKMPLSALKRCLNDESGLKGIAGTSDMRKILKCQDDLSILAKELYVHCLVKGIAAMAASLGGVDYLVFSGGIGENSAEIREIACARLTFLGLSLDKRKNTSCKSDSVISKSTSPVKIFRIAAGEEWLIAKETNELIKKSL